MSEKRRVEAEYAAAEYELTKRLTFKQRLNLRLGAVQYQRPAKFWT